MACGQDKRRGGINAGVFGSDSGQGLYRAWFMDPEQEYTGFTMYNVEQSGAKSPRGIHILQG
jgi:hypothetical protein